MIAGGCGRGAAQAPEVPFAKGSFSGLYEWYGQNEVPLPEPPANSYRRFVWRELETSEGRYDFSAIEASLQAARAKRQKFAFRVMSCWSGEGAVVPAYLVRYMPHGFWFASSGGRTDTYVPDWNSNAYQDHAKQLLTALGKRFDGDPALGWVDIGLYGNWGEWHVANFPYPQHPDTSPASFASKRALIDAHISAFPLTRLLMMTDDPEGLAYALRQSPDIGMRRDSLGDRWFDQGLHANGTAWQLASERWKTAPFVTEFYAPSPSGMLRLAAQQVSAYHVTLVGNGNTTAHYADMSISDRLQFSSLNALAGAQFVATNGSAGLDRARKSLRVTFDLQNLGNAPAYDPWNLECVIRRPGGPAFASAKVDLDLRTLLPLVSIHQDLTITLPFRLDQGDYEVLLIGQDPSGYLRNLPIGTVADAATRGALLFTLRL